MSKDPLDVFLRTLPDFPVRSQEGHKGTYGLSVITGGSRGMSGAVALAGRGALVAGSGLVRLLVPDRILETVASFTPEYMTVPLSNDADGKIAESAFDDLLSNLEKAAAAAIGPGLGRSPELDRLVQRIFFESPVPLVVDADALNALSSVLFIDRSRTPVGLRIMTPHPGEFARLSGSRPPGDRAGRSVAVRAFALKYREFFGQSPIILLKGHETVITDGEEVYVNLTGNPGMATGGSGDVLTGIITGLLAQHLPPLDAVRLGVALHGLAGDNAAAELPYESILASDLIRYFPKALSLFREHRGVLSDKQDD